MTIFGVILILLQSTYGEKRFSSLTFDYDTAIVLTYHHEIFCQPLTVGNMYSVQ